MIHNVYIAYRDSIGNNQMGQQSKLPLSLQFKNTINSFFKNKLCTVHYWCNVEAYKQFYTLKR